MANHQSTKRERFEKVAGSRVQKIIDMVGLLGNCANTNNYEYSEADVEKMFAEINKAVKNARAAYANAKDKAEKKCFTF